MRTGTPTKHTRQAATGHRPPPLNLRGAAKAFWRHPSPWILLAALTAAVVARAVAAGTGGRPGGGDLIVVGVVVASFPVVEWLIHVGILHLRPVRVGPVTLDPLLAREHRAHHADPRDIPRVFIPWQTYLWLLPVLVTVPVLTFSRVELALTFLLVVAVLGFTYEWVHYLIHSDYVPRRRLYRAVWRNHRLHHYKNERYWFSVTTSGTSDRLFGTHPDPSTVPSSPTAKDLLASFER